MSPPSRNTDSPETPRAKLAEKKARLQALKEQARERYSSGAPALRVAALISEMTDRLILELWQEALATLPEAGQRELQAGTAILAVGGSGRGELCPSSDADILFLHQPQVAAKFGAVVSQLVRDCWDAGITLGQSVRTPQNALGMALREPQFATALVEARWLWGSNKLFERFQWQFAQRLVKRRFRTFYTSCLEARDAERAIHGFNVGQLEPDVKRASGGLRDIHLIRWLGFARFGTTNLDLLRLQGALDRLDLAELMAAHQFLTRIRVDLHFAAGKAQEVLLRSEQVRLAECFGYADSGGQLAVEHFMRDYFRHTTAVADIAARFAARHRPYSWLKRLVRFMLTHRSTGVFRVRPDEIDVVPSARKEICSHLESLLDLFKLAGLYGVPLSPALQEHVRRSVAEIPEHVSQRAAATFLWILSRRGDLGNVLRSMYRLGVLEKVLPAFRHARCLLQFNQYHKYTVDEHTLRALEIVENFEHDGGLVGRAYREIPDKTMLHLSLLLHDLGKGFPEDHSLVGLRIAQQTADRLWLTESQRETLSFLVHQHLLLAHLAFRRDLSDPTMLVQFSREVGSQERLRMLFALTVADVTAVGPGTWTDWKAQLLHELYQRTLQALGGDAESASTAEVLRRIRESVLRLLPSRTGEHGQIPAGREQAAPDDSLALLETFPARYLLATSPEQLAADLQAVSHLVRQPVFVRGRYDAQTATVEFRVITRETVTTGLFSRIAGALTAKGMEILSAEICTAGEGIVVDVFHGRDHDYSGAVPEIRLQEISATIREVVSGERSVESLLRRHTRFSDDVPPPLLPAPPRIVIDNASSEKYTIIDIFAHDRTGLLYVITDTLRALGISVALAKIATHLDQVLDVFYVTDPEGEKLREAALLSRIQETLQQRLELFDRQGLVATER